MNNEPVILGFSSKKQGGKSTAVKSIIEKLHGMGLNTDPRYGDVKLSCGVISFADELKDILCRTLVPYDWIDQGTDILAWVEDNKDTMLPCGLTVRQGLQEIGTKWFRSRWPETWINSWKRRVVRSWDLVLVADIRFPNEVQAVQDMGGHVIRFTRAPFAEQDQDASEIALDKMPIRSGGCFVDDHGIVGIDMDCPPDVGFDACVKNTDMNISQQNEVVWDLLINRCWLPEVYCHACSKAGDAERAIYHTPPVCKDE